MDVLGPRVVLWVVGQVDRRLVVKVEGDCAVIARRGGRAGRWPLWQLQRLRQFQPHRRKAQWWVAFYCST
eukprot:4951688-Pleurochrysis_carterae.AAC.1